MGLSAWDVYKENEGIVGSIKQCLKGELVEAMSIVGDKYFETRFSPVFDKDQKVTGVFGVAVDVTEQRQAVNALRISEQKFLNIYNLSPDMVGITRQTDGKIMAGNPALTKLTGFEPEEYMDHTTAELKWWANPEDRNIVINTLHEKGEISNFEIGMRIKNGNILTCLFSAKAIVFNEEPCLLFVVHDITERKQIEKLISDERNILRALIDNIPDMVYVKDTGSRFVLANKTLAALLSTAPEAMIGENGF